jgi:hypothetical protein
MTLARRPVPWRSARSFARSLAKADAGWAARGPCSRARGSRAVPATGEAGWPRQRSSRPRAPAPHGGGSLPVPRARRPIETGPGASRRWARRREWPRRSPCRLRRAGPPPAARRPAPGVRRCRAAAGPCPVHRRRQPLFAAGRWLVVPALGPRQRAGQHAVRLRQQHGRQGLAEPLGPPQRGLFAHLLQRAELGPGQRNPAVVHMGHAPRVGTVAGQQPRALRHHRLGQHVIPALQPHQRGQRQQLRIFTQADAAAAEAPLDLARRLQRQRSAPFHQRRIPQEMQMVPIPIAAAWHALRLQCRVESLLHLQGLLIGAGAIGKAADVLVDVASHVHQVGRRGCFGAQPVGGAFGLARVR